MPLDAPRVLLKTNTVLRAKEAVQLQLLHSYERNLQHLGPIIMQTTDTKQQTSVLAAAAVMDVKAQELLKELRSNSISPTPLCNNPDMENSHESGTTTSISSSSGIFPRSPTEQLSRTQRLWANVTHNAVRAMEGISIRDLAGKWGPQGVCLAESANMTAAACLVSTWASLSTQIIDFAVGTAVSLPVAEGKCQFVMLLWCHLAAIGCCLTGLQRITRDIPSTQPCCALSPPCCVPAERFKHCIMRLALVTRCSTNLAGLPDGVESALDAMGLLTMVAQVAATEQVLEVQWYAWPGKLFHDST